jgi:Flp pilus assembly protein TadD
LGRLLLHAGQAEAALQEARKSAARDPRLHLSRILEAAALLQTGREDEARIALATARRIRPALTLQEVARANGRRLAARLQPLWA